ncbi:DUF3106 domain-containing protein [Simplicispira psychrophila]|uniref:DUF3106 domain-containing protein n=1 Tax=Simplicispira psychrophila TaxID=80882 RepID=UPI000481805B|nr:DUF3106 domain-containing protein [Simplicispira psychrophila]
MYASSPDARRTTPAFVLALALLGALTFGGFQVWQQGRMAPGTVVPAEAFAASSTAHSHHLQSEKNPTPTPGPAWEQLDAAQKIALQPLAPRWAILSELQKRRWLALAKNFPALPPTEQERLHARMSEWASLSAQQRSQARFNYAVTSKLSADSKRAQWEAYQALSAEEKNRLAAAATRRSMGAATAVRPVATRKLAKVPAATAAANNPANPPKIPATADWVTPTATETKPVAVVETAPVIVPVAVPIPLPPLTPSTETAVPMSPDAAAQYSH